MNIGQAHFIENTSTHSNEGNNKSLKKSNRKMERLGSVLIWTCAYDAFKIFLFLALVYILFNSAGLRNLAENIMKTISVNSSNQS